MQPRGEVSAKGKAVTCGECHLHRPTVPVDELEYEKHISTRCIRNEKKVSETVRLRGPCLATSRERGVFHIPPIAWLAVENRE